MTDPQPTREVWAEAFNFALAWFGDDPSDIGPSELADALLRFAAQHSTAAQVSGDARERANVIYDAALVDGTRGRSKLMAEQDIASITPQIEQAIIVAIAALLPDATPVAGDARRIAEGIFRPGGSTRMWGPNPIDEMIAVVAERFAAALTAADRARGDG